MKLSPYLIASIVLGVLGMIVWFWLRRPYTHWEPIAADHNPHDQDEEEMRNKARAAKVGRLKFGCIGWFILAAIVYVSLAMAKPVKIVYAALHASPTPTVTLTPTPTNTPRFTPTPRNTNTPSESITPLISSTPRIINQIVIQTRVVYVPHVYVTVVTVPVYWTVVWMVTPTGSPTETATATETETPTPTETETLVP